MSVRAFAVCLLFALLLPLSASAQRKGKPPAPPPPPPGAPEAPANRLDQYLGPQLEFLRFESPALKGNLIGDPHEREFAVLLPPSYLTSPERKYPVVYLLHGLGKRKDGHLDSLYVLRGAYEEMLRGRLGEMVIVAVDGTTSFGGSYYANSPTIGNFETYVVREIVGRVDTRYRTWPHAGSRGIAGFSMGGHGAIKLAMKYPGTFSSVGSLSGSPMSMRYRKSLYKTALQKHARPTSLEDLRARIGFDRDWNAAAAYAKASAFSPSAGRPPLYLDLPFERGGADWEDPIWQSWWNADPLSLVVKHQRTLRGLKLLYLDSGDNETALGTEDFDRELVRYGISHVHYVFRGDHTDLMIERHLRMLRYFSVSWDLF